MNENKAEYTKLVSDKVRMQTGYQSANNSWKQCEVTNGTYLDCPVAKMKDKEHFTMSLAVHNPSGIDAHYLKVPVPGDGSYSAQIFKDGEFVKVNGYLQCQDNQKNCFYQLMFSDPKSNAKLSANQVSLVQLTKVSSKSS